MSSGLGTLFPGALRSRYNHGFIGRGKKRKREKTWTGKFYCLSDREKQKVPCAEEKALLQKYAKMWCHNKFYEGPCPIGPCAQPISSTRTQRQRAGLHPQTKTAWTDTAGPGLLGPNANTHTLMNHVNSRLQDIIHAVANIWVPLQLDTRALCRFARW